MTVPSSARDRSRLWVESAASGLVGFLRSAACRVHDGNEVSFDQPVDEQQG